VVVFPHHGAATGDGAGGGEVSLDAASVGRCVALLLLFSLMVIVMLLLMMGGGADLTSVVCGVMGWWS